MSVYKSVGTSVALTCARTVAATPTAGLGEVEEGWQEARQEQRISKQMLKVISSRRLAGPRPATSLAKATCEATGKLLAWAACEETSRAITLGVESSNTIDNVKAKVWEHMHADPHKD